MFVSWVAVEVIHLPQQPIVYQETCEVSGQTFRRAN